MSARVLSLMPAEQAGTSAPVARVALPLPDEMQREGNMMTEPERKPKAQQTPRSRLSKAQRTPPIRAKCPAANRKSQPCGGW